MEEGSLDEAPIWSDLRTFNGRRWRGIVDCILGGYPCQPFSIAGKQRGKADPRHLWPAIKELIPAVRPSFCLFENVSNHLRLGFPEVRSDLREMGYLVTAGLFTAEEVSAPHERKRLFILAVEDSDRAFDTLWRDLQPAWAGAAGPTGEAVADTHGAERRARSAEGSGAERERGLSEWQEDSGGAGRFREALADSTGLTEREPNDQERTIARFRTWADARRRGVQLGNTDSAGRGRSDLHLHERGQGEAVPDAVWASGIMARFGPFPPGRSDYDRWVDVLTAYPEVEPALCRVAHGDANRLDRLRLCGNGVVPLVAAKAFHVLREDFR
jgi:DNA (cytosine-5)-methyltransferase 1